MKITIELGDNYIPTLKKWASVSRTLNEARRLLEEYSELNTDPNVDDQIDANYDELGEIEPGLNHLHQALREALARQESEKYS